MKNKGFTLIEVVIITAVFMLVLAVSFRLVDTVVQKAKLSTAKIQISQMALAIEQIKEDTGYYPVRIQEVFSEAPPAGQERGWQGPYAQVFRSEDGGVNPKDPWKIPYFYQIPPTAVPPATYFASPLLGRFSGRPRTSSFTFSAHAGTGQVIVTNYGITSGRVYINGVEVIPPSSFKNHPYPQIITVSVTLVEGMNTIDVWLASTPSDYLYVSVGTPGTTAYLPTSDYFLLGTFGKDGKQGGRGYGKDVTWNSKKYPNFE